MRRQTEQSGSFAGVLFAIETEGRPAYRQHRFHAYVPGGPDRAARHHDWREGLLVAGLRRRRYRHAPALRLRRDEFEQGPALRLRGNGRAYACYRRCGFVEEGRLRQARYSEGVYSDEVVMSVLRREFYALHSAAVAQEVAR